MDQDELNDHENFFDQSYLEVDRIVYCTDMFAILHPKKALEVKNKWTELILKVV
jgi:chromodomain-helicase-DNA-binding protein 7